MDCEYSEEDFAKRCVDSRIDEGLTQKAAAERMEWGKSSLNRFEKGKGPISVEKLGSLAKILKRSAHYLLFGKEADWGDGPQKSRIDLFNRASNMDFKKAKEQLESSLTSSRKYDAYINIGRRVKWGREENGLTQQELAEKLGFTDKSTISRFENSSRNISIKELVGYINLFDIPADYFVFGLPHDVTLCVNELKKFHYFDQIKLIEATIQQMERRNRKS